MSNSPEESDSKLPKVLETHLANNALSDAWEAIEDNKFNSCLQTNCSDVVAVIMKYLTDNNYYSKPDVYDVCNKMLMTIATKSKEEEALFELLEIVETTKSDNIFMSALKSLQICLLRQKENKSRSLEWCLNSIQSYMSELPFSDDIKTKLDAEEEKLLENNSEISRILTNYLTLFLFYEPVLEKIIQNSPTLTFRNPHMTRRNVIGCFILQLLDAPLAYLDLSQPNYGSLTNTYSRQCAESIVGHLAKVFPDPFFLLSYVEQRIRRPKKVRLDFGVYENPTKDIFAIDEKIPLTALGVFYYLIFSQNLMPPNAPKVYSDLYLFESSLYIITEMLKSDENTIHYKALVLADALLHRFQNRRISAENLELNIHEEFCNELIKVITQTQIKRNCHTGGRLIKKYIFQFDNNGRLYLIKNLWKMNDHNGLHGYLTTMYKDMIAEVLKSTHVSHHFCGPEMKNIFLNRICVLPKGSETDLVQNSDGIICALNAIRFLSISDKENRTNFWDCVKDIEKHFLSPLRVGLNMSKAHYKLEEKRVRDGTDDNVELTVISAEIPEMTIDYKLNMIANAMNTFEVMECLLSRVIECIDNVQRKF